MADESMQLQSIDGLAAGNKMFQSVNYRKFKITRSYPALRAADLDWIVGPGYSLGGYFLEKNYENQPTTMKKQPGTIKNHKKPIWNHEKP